MSPSFDVRTPHSVGWSPTTINELPAERAAGLVLQHEAGDVVWATRGYAVYRSIDSGPFERAVSVRPPLGEAWGGYVPALRRRLGYQELVELLPIADDVLVAFAAGHVYRIDLSGRKVERTHALRYFGRGKGRGVMAFGVTSAADGRLYYGEYPTSGQETIRVWRSDDGGVGWAVAHEFRTGIVRHIHAVQWDPYGARLWVAAGDRDEESRIGFSTDSGTHMEWIGSGAQAYRACSLLFFRGAVVWGMDADFEPNFVNRWDRATHTIVKGSPLPDATYYAQSLGDDRGLLGICQGTAAVWVVDAHGRADSWLDWRVPPVETPRPAGIRLARGDSRSAYVYLNPLRTTDEDSAVLRVRREFVPGRKRHVDPPSS